MAREKTLLELIDNLTWHNAIEKLKEILRRFLASQSSYKVITGFLSQTGTNAPVATILENTVGDVTFEYGINAGYYDVTNTEDLFTTNKTIMMFGSNKVPDSDFLVLCGVYSMNATTITFVSSFSSDLQDADNNLISNTPFEIRVYN